MAGYGEDLAYIHHVGYSGFVTRAAPALIRLIRRTGLRGRIVDLGCGSGVLAREFTRAGYPVLGVDISPAMIALARANAPEAEFIVGSLLDIDLPPCAAVTAIGECLNYLFDPRNSRRRLDRLFRGVYEALSPGGLFAFDIAEPRESGANPERREFWRGPDWTVLLRARENVRRGTMTREIVAYRAAGDLYRMSEEIHRLRLYKASDLAERLRATGFEVTIQGGYGRARLPAAHAAILARKPRTA
ncbi:MAG: class I SAM-dependent methyltransferase [Bryobacteraceae bacterium]|nr:class I SAM-dependent methyltransferase [Bryobacteraceae bacterium]